ncbi:HK97 family phage prohead protease [Mycobacteroides abscessus]|uniref:HK97 family phage prohead protease n=1 Tax=Mycobacteroides abscessus TaxID=36809 RepID=UPI000D3E0A1A|nr:HK97 family phage prohead protease [Mycobacteroides abscessus]PVA36497.1 HK97 family phage prohead protease [Mycobacteroides abscessus]PVA43960.1 HK97 family phage prohead protease [Mycobacteroides abscessus]RIQ90759.1 HK97 family phage prohead protease [Mycobacteroides abscessus]RIQ98899.1 HK97 family phage prohead protease [Mycobacteroides abscessus]
MTINLIRSSALELPPDGTVRGLLVPYGQVRDQSDNGTYRERFEPGAFARSIRERGDKIRVFDGNHKPIGRVANLWEQPDGLYAELELQGARSGALSVSFRPVRERQDGDVLVRTEAALMEISVGVQRSETRIANSVAVARLKLLDW